MAISKTKEVLINGLSLILQNKEVITAIALLLKSEEQMATMITYIYEHQKENPSEDEVIQVAKKISEQIS